MAAGPVAMVVRGAALVDEVAGRKAPAGTTWVLVDVAVAASDAVPLVQVMRFHLEDPGQGLFQIAPDEAVTRALDPTLFTAQLGPEQPVRGLLAFAVPESVARYRLGMIYRPDGDWGRPDGRSAGVSLPTNGFSH